MQFFPRYIVYGSYLGDIDPQYKRIVKHYDDLSKAAKDAKDRKDQDHSIRIAIYQLVEVVKDKPPPWETEAE